jgi:hypothetical protein
MIPLTSKVDRIVFKFCVLESQKTAAMFGPLSLTILCLHSMKDTSDNTSSPLKFKWFKALMDA